MPSPRFSTADIQSHSKWLYGVSLTWSEAEMLWCKLVVLSKTHGWSTKEVCGTSCGIAIWLKSRLCEMGKFTCDHTPLPEFSDAVTMHIFFLHIEETPEQLARLQCGDSVPSASPSRSRIQKYMESKPIQPIDRTALNVAPPPLENTATPKEQA